MIRMVSQMPSIGSFWRLVRKLKTCWIDLHTIYHLAWECLRIPTYYGGGYMDYFS